MNAVSKNVLIIQQFSWRTPIHNQIRKENHYRTYMRGTVLRAEPQWQDGTLILPTNSYRWTIRYPDFKPYDDQLWRRKSGSIILLPEELAGEAIAIPEPRIHSVREDNDYRFQTGGLWPKCGNLEIIIGDAARLRSAARILYDTSASLS